MVIARTKAFSHRLHDLYEKQPLLMNSIIGGLVYVVGELIVELQNANDSLKIGAIGAINSKFFSSASEKQENVSKDAENPNNKKISYLNFHIDDDNNVENMISLGVIDWNRVAHIGLLGIIENGILMLVWYRFLSKIVGNDTRTITVIIKCILDQIFFATQQDAIFLGYCGYLHSSRLELAWEEMSSQFLTTWINDCSLWPIVNFVGFAYIPTSLQPTYMSFVQLFWQIYISSMAAPKSTPLLDTKELGNDHRPTNSSDASKKVEPSNVPCSVCEQKTHQVILRKGIKNVSQRVKSMEKDMKDKNEQGKDTISRASNSSTIATNNSGYAYNGNKELNSTPNSASKYWFHSADAERVQALTNAKYSFALMASLACARTILCKI